MVTVDFKTEPRGDAYAGLLNEALAVAACDRCLLVVRDWGWLDEAGRGLLDQLKPFLVSEMKHSEWPGTRLLDGEATVLQYDYREEVANVLIGSVDGLYGWRPPLPEDLCLLSGEHPWLVSIAHENDGYLCVDGIDDLVERRPDLASVFSVRS